MAHRSAPEKQATGRRRVPVLLSASLGVCALGIVTAAPATAAGGGDDSAATVSVFHGVPDLDVDVYANGEELLPDFEPGTLTDPMELKAGSYEIEIFEAGADPEKDDAAIEKSVDVPAGGNATLVAHLDAEGDPQLNAFVDDVSKVPAGKSRLTVRHVAAAPAVDVRAGGTPVFEGLENPKEKSAEVDAGSVEADVTLAGTDDVAIGPADLDLKEGTSTVVYAWGSADDENLALKTQSLKASHSAPGGVDAGGGDRMAAGAAPANSSSDWLAWSAAAGMAALVGAFAVRRRALREATVRIGMGDANPSGGRGNGRLG